LRATIERNEEAPPRDRGLAAVPIDPAARIEASSL
jgi:hypothetical protein